MALRQILLFTHSFQLFIFERVFDRLIYCLATGAAIDSSNVKRFTMLEIQTADISPRRSRTPSFSMTSHGYRPPHPSQDYWIYLPTNLADYIPAGTSLNHRGQTRDPWRGFYGETRSRYNNVGLASLPSAAPSHAPIPLLVIEEYRTYSGGSLPPVAPTPPAYYYGRGDEESRLSPEEQKQALNKLRKHLYSPHINSIINRLGTKSSSRPVDLAQYDNGTKRCAVCLDDFESKQFVTMTPCNHMFHEDCIVPWVKSQGKCPVCRFVIY